jgi:hypothetical protein
MQHPAEKIMHRDPKHNLKRRSRSRGLNTEELFREALAQQKEKELLKHQTNFQENSSGVHLSELERSGPVHRTDQKPKADKIVSSLFDSGRKTKTTRSN